MGFKDVLKDSIPGLLVVGGAILLAMLLPGGSSGKSKETDDNFSEGVRDAILGSDAKSYGSDYHSGYSIWKK